MPEQQTLIPVFDCDDGPDNRPIHALHRANDGYIAFARKSATGEFENLWSVKASEMDGYFPQMSPYLETDSFFSINAFYRDGRGVSRNSPNGTALKNVHRDRKSVSHLTAVFADLDCYNVGLTVG